MHLRNYWRVLIKDKKGVAGNDEMWPRMDDNKQSEEGEERKGNKREWIVG